MLLWTQRAHACVSPLYVRSEGAFLPLPSGGSVPGLGVSLPSHNGGLLARGSGVSVARELLPRLLLVPRPVRPRWAVGGAGAGPGIPVLVGLRPHGP